MAGERATLQSVLLRDNGIRTRSYALDSVSKIFASDPETLQRRFALLCAAAGQPALAVALVVRHLVVHG